MSPAGPTPPRASRARTALVIGRFQPPHQGHIHLLRSAASSAGSLVVAIGSADKSHSVRDPFTAGERIRMLHAALDEAGIKATHIIPVDDLGRYALWVAHVQAHCPPFDLVVTGSPLTERLFRDAGVPVETVETVDRERLEATSVRARLFRGEDVTDAVPKRVRDILSEPWARERIDAVRRAAEGEG
ncbi:MAG: nicotinamide-nucleotide adenylyltransferase [Euryarchaeota archaeon]|nr:nicotinamide-nucleotide adenylyltransferase [Euryarchaeota archaeon]